MHGIGQGTLLEMAALNNGFDRSLSVDGAWRSFASTQSPLRIWLGPAPDGGAVVGMSQRNVLRALEGVGAPAEVALAPGAVGARRVSNLPELHAILRRAFQLSRTLPDELLHVFEKEVSALRRETEAERLVVQRVGQDVFRRGLLEYWEGRCAVSGLAVPELLRASHIKPWADCGSDAERLDVFNGLLLSAQLDAAFDGGFVTFEDDGRIRLSEALGVTERALLGLSMDMRIKDLGDAHRPYLQWHRARVYRSGSQGSR
jgi:putative restriction endonuclease